MRWGHFARASGHASLLHQRHCAGMGDWLGNLRPLVVPRLKLAFCSIPKIASTNFKDLINGLNRLNTTQGFGIADYFASEPAALNVSTADMTRENGWRFAAFTRDPLQRYLSAWGSTCLQSDGGDVKHPQECCGTFLWNHAPPQHLVQSFEARAGYDAIAGLPQEEEHWASQVQVLWHCGWELFKPETLDFRGNLSAGAARAQVEAMLRLAGADEEDLKLAGALFGEGAGKGSRSFFFKDARSRKLLREWPEAFYRSRLVVEAVKHIYSADFALLPGIGDHFTAQMEASAQWPQ